MKPPEGFEGDQGFGRFVRVRLTLDRGPRANGVESNGTRVGAPRSVISRFAHYVWAAPCTAAGLCLVAPAFLLGARAQVVKGVIEVAVSAHREPGTVLRALPFNAITFGHVVVATTRSELQRLRTHEHEHVRQYERWGALFFAAYP